MEKIYFHNKKDLDKKIRQIKKDGLNKLHVVADFDRTLTKRYINGKKTPSGISLIRQGGYLTKDYPKKAFALADKYYPIEIDESLDYDYRYKMMREWWDKHFKLLIKSKMNKEVLKDIMEKNNKIFRNGTFEFFNMLKNSNIPLLIFSAGLGDLIEGFLKKDNILSSNVHILSNKFKFDKKGLVIGYKNDIIHIMNKSETKIKNKKYKALIKKRHNAILLGDSVEDVGMINDLETNISIKIGFLNEDVKKKLTSYKEVFDVVITGDGSMNYVNKLTKRLIYNK